MCNDGAQKHHWVVDEELYIFEYIPDWFKIQEMFIWVSEDLNEAFKQHKAQKAKTK